MNILLVVFWEKISFGAIGSFQVIFNVRLGVVKIEPGHCYYWIPKLFIFILFTQGLF